MLFVPLRRTGDFIRFTSEKSNQLMLEVKRSSDGHFLLTGPSPRDDIVVEHTDEGVAITGTLYDLEGVVARLLEGEPDHVAYTDVLIEYATPGGVKRIKVVGHPEKLPPAES